MNKPFFSSTCFKTNNFDDLIALAKKNQVYNLELSGNLAYEPQVISKLKQEKRFSWLIHNYFPRPRKDFVLNLASKTSSVRQKSLNQCKKAITLCQKLNIPHYSVHAGFLTDLKPNDLGKLQSGKKGINRKEGFRIFKQSVTSLLKFINHTQPINLLIENNVCSKINLINGQNQLYLLADLNEIELFFKQMRNYKNLGLLLDCGHLNVSSSQLDFDKHQFIERLANKIMAFHLNSNNGLEDQNKLFIKNEWFIKVLNQPRFINLPRIIEVSSKNRLSDILKLMTVLD